MEDDFQKALNDAYVELNENTFKELRRALPLTRHKIDWDKVCSYGSLLIRFTYMSRYAGI